MIKQLSCCLALLAIAIAGPADGQQLANQTRTAQGTLGQALLIAIETWLSNQFDLPNIKEHWPASFCDGDAAGPAMTDVFTLLGRGAFFRAPFRNSISSACRPTMRSNAAILASYSWSRSAAWASSSKAPASYF